MKSWRKKFAELIEKFWKMYISHHSILQYYDGVLGPEINKYINK